MCLFLCRSHFRRKKKVGEVGAHGGNLSSAVPPPQSVRLLLLSPFTISYFLIHTTLVSSPFRVSVCRSEPDLRQGEGRRGSASPQHLSRRGGTRGGRGSRGEQRGRRWKWRDRPVWLWGVVCEWCSFWQGRLLYDHTRCAEHSQWTHTHTHCSLHLTKLQNHNVNLPVEINSLILSLIVSWCMIFCHVLKCCYLQMCVWCQTFYLPSHQLLFFYVTMEVSCYRSGELTLRWSSYSWADTGLLSSIYGIRLDWIKGRDCWALVEVYTLLSAILVFHA